MRITLEKNEGNNFWIYAKNDTDMEKVMSVSSKMESYGYVICHIDEADNFVMLSAVEGETQLKIREDYAAAKVA